MKNALDAVNETLLMGPGPSCVPAEVYAALGQPTIGHLDPRFLAIMNEIKIMLQKAMGTANRVTFPISGTGSAGMEACFVNLVERGDRVLVLANGVFGGRMVDVATRLGANVDALEFPWGTPVLLDAVKDKLSQGRYKIVAVVHAETSTGVRNPVAEIGELLKGSGALYVVDTVTSLGGIEVKMDEWGVDAMYSGSQKCLSCPPGLAPLSFSERAVDALSRRATKVPNWYLDVSMIMKYWEGASRAYHHTAPINMLYGLCRALELLFEEGLDQARARHLQCHKQLVRGLREQGLEMLAEAGCRLPMLNSVRCPAGIDEARVRARLLENHGIEIGAGLGPLAGKIWRVGLMGHTARPQNVQRLLDALAAELCR
jgi:alanine-glyoxylate transaminase / serine-glyoxylate transaminase / serine-pyruvate transaminase